MVIGPIQRWDENSTINIVIIFPHFHTSRTTKSRKLIFFSSPRSRRFLLLAGWLFNYHFWIKNNLIIFSILFIFTKMQAIDRQRNPYHWKGSVPGSDFAREIVSLIYSLFLSFASSFYSYSLDEVEDFCICFWFFGTHEWNFLKLIRIAMRLNWNFINLWKKNNSFLLLWWWLSTVGCFVKTIDFP